MSLRSQGVTLEHASDPRMIPPPSTPMHLSLRFIATAAGPRPPYVFPMDLVSLHRKAGSREVACFCDVSESLALISFHLCCGSHLQRDSVIARDSNLQSWVQVQTVSPSIGGRGWGWGGSRRIKLSFGRPPPRGKCSSLFFPSHSLPRG